MVAFKSRSLLYFDARTWTLIIAWYQIITCTLDMSRTQRQLVKHRLNSELPVIYHNFTTSRGRPNPNRNGGKTQSEGSSGSSNVPSSSLDVYKIEGGGKDRSNQSITLIISLDGRHSNNQNVNANDNDHVTPSPLSVISSFTIPTTFPSKVKDEENKEKDRGRSLFPDQKQNLNTLIIKNDTSTYQLSVSFPQKRSSSNNTLSVWDEIQNLNGNSSSSNVPRNVSGNVSSLPLLSSNPNSNTLNDTNLNNETLSSVNGSNGTSVENVTRSDLSDNETKSQFIFRFRYTIIMLYAEIVVYAVTAVSAIVLIIGTNRGSAWMLMTWLTVNWLNFLLALFAMIIVMLRGLPMNTFLYYAIKAGVRMLFIRVVSIHRRELLIYNDICEHLATIRAAQEAVFTMSDGMAHVNYANP